MKSGSSFNDSLALLLRRQAMSFPHVHALLAPGRKPMAYAALWQQVQDVAVTLAGLGVTRGERVALVLPNGPEMAAAFLAVAAWTACAPLNPAYRATEFRFFLEDARVRLVLIAAGERGPVFIVAQELGLAVVEVEACLSEPAGSFRLRTHSSEQVSPAGFATAGEVALVLHTSGTTGRPKLVPLTHQKLLASANGIAQHLGLRPPDRCLNVMPLFHIHGLVGALLASLVSGASVVCAPGFQDLVFFDWIASFLPTWYTAVPTIHHAVVEQGAQYSSKAPTHRFRFVRSSSAALPAKAFEALRALFGVPIVESYGMTEASHQMASNPVFSGTQKSGSVGVPAGVEIALLDSAGQRIAQGDVGEIVIRGSSVFDGYENNPDANLQAFVDGWFRTGDQGRFDTDGYLFITGRISEFISRGGEKIAPSEIDEALLKHPDVAQAVAFAVTHPTLGQDVAAAVVLYPGAIADESALRTFLSQGLADFKVPSTIVVVDAIPKGATGKIQRKSLEEKLGDLIAKARAIDDNRDIVPPDSEAERAVADIWGRVLGIEHISITDNFFNLGGRSILAVRAANEMETLLGVRIEVRRMVTETLEQIASSTAPGANRVLNAPGATASPTTVTPFFFGADDRRLFGLFQSAQDSRSDATAVLLCNPFGQEAVRAHRLYAVLADRLVRAGVCVLRFDYFGTGDSAGEDTDGEITGWTSDLIAAHDELVRRSGAGRIVWVGARIGATLAVMASNAVARPPHRMVLWEPVVDGSGYLSEMARRHLQNLESAHCSPEPPWPEIRASIERELDREGMGFELGAELRDQLARLTPLSMPTPRALGCDLIEGGESNEVVNLLQRWRQGGLAVDEVSFVHDFDWMAALAMNTSLVPGNAIALLTRLALDRR